MSGTIKISQDAMAGSRRLGNVWTSTFVLKPIFQHWDLLKGTKIGKSALQLLEIGNIIGVTSVFLRFFYDIFTTGKTLLNGNKSSYKKMFAGFYGATNIGTYVPAYTLYFVAGTSPVVTGLLTANALVNVLQHFVALGKLAYDYHKATPQEREILSLKMKAKSKKIATNLAFAAVSMTLTLVWYFIPGSSIFAASAFLGLGIIQSIHRRLEKKKVEKQQNTVENQLKENATFVTQSVDQASPASLNVSSKATKVAPSYPQANDDKFNAEKVSPFEKIASPNLSHQSREEKPGLPTSGNTRHDSMQKVISQLSRVKHNHPIETLLERKDEIKIKVKDTLHEAKENFKEKGNDIKFKFDEIAAGMKTSLN